ncbi:ATP-binding protein [Bradyrhizobium sp.]|uniref:sensor histidine kinase n=1 Tax=Bradyrhizobium sp. TaxID=376 RepID=UPI003C28003D
MPGRLGGLGWRLLVRVLFFSSVITLLLTLLQLYFDYRRDVQAIDLRMSEIDSVYSRSLGDGLWRLDARQLRLQVEGILHLPDISYVELREATDRAVPAPFVVTAGSRQANAPMRREFRIIYADHGPEQLLGILVVEATFEPVYRRLVDTAAVIMVSQAIKTFVVSFFILLIVHRLITRHLTAIATSLRGYDLRGSHLPLRLARHSPRPADELDGLVGAFNQMYSGLQAAYGDLREREAKIRRLVDSNIIGILIIDLDGQIIEANDAFLRMVGYDREDLVAGRVRWTNSPPEWREADPARVEKVKTTGALQAFEKEYFRKDGSRMPALVGVARIEEAENQAVAFVVDLTERKRAEAELAHANRVATMGQLSASIAHEVNQPIAATLMNAGTALRWLARQPPNLEEATQAVEHIIKDGKRAADIVSRIRNFSKNAPAQNGDLEINEAILEIMTLARAAASQHGVFVKMQLSEGLPPIVGDRVQLQQVILNLIMNAIEALSEVGEGSRELLISSSEGESGGVLVAVADSGPGLPHTNPERMFDAFYTTKASGLGMGLSICRSIIQNHGGRLWAMPNQPHGAVFYVMLRTREKSLENLESSEA